MALWRDLILLYSIQSLWKYFAKDQKDWDKYVTLILFALRNFVCEAIDDRPFYVLYGREPRLPTDVKLLPKEYKYLTTCVFEHRKRIVKKVELAQNIAKGNIQRSQQKMKEYYDQRAKMTTFELGQRVWVYTRKTKKGLSKKLLHNPFGPYRIVEKSSPVHFWLRTDSNKKITFAVHANRMKPFVDPYLRSIDPPLFVDPSKAYLDESDIAKDCFVTCDSSDNSANSEKSVSPDQVVTQSKSQPEKKNSVDNQSIFRSGKILNRRRRKRKPQYLVKWENHPKNQSTWESEEQLLDKRLIENFVKSRA